MYVVGTDDRLQSLIAGGAEWSTSWRRGWRSSAECGPGTMLTRRLEPNASRKHHPAMIRHIAEARTDAEVAACYPVLAGLRPHVTAGSFVALVRRLGAETGLTLAAARTGGAEGPVVAVAGYRVSEWLAGGRYLEIEDLITRAADRSAGHGGALFDWLVDLAARRGCNHLRLVSHVRRHDAHRFYQRKGMTLEAHYFSLPIDR